MWSGLFLGFLFVVQTKSLSVLTDDRPQTSGPDGESAKTDILRQLLNQETIIRMALDKKVYDLDKDFIEMKENMAEMKNNNVNNNKQLQDAKREIETNKQQLQDAKREIETNKQQLQDAKREIETNNQQLQDAKAEIAVLKDEIRSLRTKFNASNLNAFKFQKEVEIKFEATEENITQLLYDQERYGRKLSNDVEIFKTNTTNDLADIRRDVRSLFSSMLILENQTTKLNTSLLEAIDKKLTDVSAHWNRSLSELNHRFVYTWSKLDNDHANKMAQLSDGINDTINTMKTEVNQSQKSQLELSSAVSSIVSSLEVIRRNMSVLNGPVKDTPVAFTAGMTTYSSTWQGDILVFPHVINNKGQGYSSSSGKFTAPRDGTYVFTVTAVSFGSNYLSLDIVHDGVRKVRTYSSDTARYQTGTNLVVLELDRGDAVWVKRYYGQGYYTYSVPLTTFSGFIL
uniref:Myosin-11-like n=1 Tax=Crassostrea virginica TaxID=6565 RepID=A0A8B8A6S6_CRAVI|nr:myosin-11-like [Crassostrea virginica]